MSKAQTQLAATLEARVGSANVTANPALSIDGLAPVLLINPASAAEAADCLRVCSETGLAVVPAGQGTWLECGNPLRRADAVLSLERMSRVIDYSAPDLTITVEAGMPLRKLNETTGRDRLWLPLDPPGTDTASVGAMVACNSSGALRCGYGTPRDYVIGLKLAHVDGTESKSGGRVAKNVAGYDLNKLYVGSYGTLAVITELTFKLRPLPEQSVTLIVTATQPESLIALAQQARASELQPVAFVLAAMPLAEWTSSKQAVNALLLRFADNESAVKYQVDWLRLACGELFEIVEVSGDTEAALWTKINGPSRALANAVKMSVPLSQTIQAHKDVLAVALKDQTVEIASDLGSGIIRMTWNGSDETSVRFIQEQRAHIQQLGGTLFVERASTSVRREVGAWGEAGTGERLMKAIKEKFDPQGILNPGRFVAGL
jgi:glycolate oxidase FAD binding subunit